MAYPTQGEKREALLGYIAEHIKEYGYPPTVREMQTALNFSSTSMVGHYLKALQAEGKIQIDFGKARGITILGSGSHGKYQDLVDAAYAVAKDEDNKGAKTIYDLICVLEALN